MNVIFLVVKESQLTSLGCKNGNILVAIRCLTNQGGYYGSAEDPRDEDDRHLQARQHDVQASGHVLGQALAPEGPGLRPGLVPMEHHRQLRPSKCLVLSPTPDGFEGLNPLVGEPFALSAAFTARLAGWDEWIGADALANDPVAPVADDDVDALVGCGVLIERHSAIARTEKRFLNEWGWGLPAAAYHFTLRDRSFVSVQVSEDRQVAKADIEPSPPLYTVHDERDPEDAVSALRLPARTSDLMQLMARRRSAREANGAVLPVATLASVLHAGLGITGTTSNRAGDLPLKMTPSGGARNPFEGYVVAKNVDGLVPGVYHYSAKQHSLRPQIGAVAGEWSKCLGNQPWIDDAAAIILLNAQLERTMWKYDDPAGYRVVLIEAGHVAQNMLLMATELNWAGCPTAAIDPANTFALCGIEDDILSAPLYAVTLMRQIA